MKDIYNKKYKYSEAIEIILYIFFWILSGVAWILLGVLTFRWIDVDSFGTAFWWLIIWHIATAIFRIICIGIYGLIRIILYQTL